MFTCCVNRHNQVPIHNLEKLLIQLRQKVGDVLKKNFHHPINRRMAAKSKKVVLVSNMNFESGFVSYNDNGDDHSSVDSRAKEGGSHPEAA